MRSSVPDSVHPRTPPKFRNQDALLEHVVKHVIRARREDWSEQLGLSDLDELIIEARDELARTSYLNGGPVTDRIAESYQAYAGRLLLERLEVKSGHQHYVGTLRPRSEDDDEAPSGVVTDDWVTICAWSSPRSRVLWTICRARVRKGSTGPYHLQTSYQDDHCEPWKRELLIDMKKKQNIERGLRPFRCPAFSRDGGSR
jgi:hypothetical protein